MRRFLSWAGGVIAAVVLTLILAVSIVAATSNHYKIEQLIANGNFDLSDTMTKIAISSGMFEDLTNVHVLGFNEQIDAGAVEKIWMFGGGYPFPAAAETLTVVSSSAADDKDAGTGAQYITVIGLDASYAEISETIAMEGLTPSVGSTLFFRINSVCVSTAGTGRTNAGNIAITNTITTDTIAYIGVIDEGTGCALQAIYTVPVNKTLYVLEHFGAIGQGSSATDSMDIHMHTIRNGVGVETTESIMGLLSSGTSHWEHTHAIAEEIPAKSDTYIEGHSGTNGMSVQAGFHGILVSNN